MTQNHYHPGDWLQFSDASDEDKAEYRRLTRLAIYGPARRTQCSTRATWLDAACLLAVGVAVGAMAWWIVDKWSG